MPPRFIDTVSRNLRLNIRIFTYIYITILFFTLFSSSALAASKLDSPFKSAPVSSSENAGFPNIGITAVAVVAVPGTGSVAYDSARGLLSIRANNIALGDLIRRLLEKTSLSIKVLRKDLLKEKIRFQIKNAPLEAALKKLFKDKYNATYVYSVGKSADKSTARPRLSKVIILSKVASADRQGGRDSASSPDSAISNSETAGTPISVNRPGSNTPAGALLDAIEDRLNTWHSSNTPADIDSLKKDLDKLKELAPEQKPDPITIAPVVDSLAGVLKDSELDTSLRVNAAEVLGLLGSERAVKPLTEVFQRKERFVRDAAARGLVRIGSPEAMGAVFKVFDQYRSFNMHQSSIHAVMANGDAKAKKELSETIKAGKAIDGTYPPDFNIVLNGK